MKIKDRRKKIETAVELHEGFLKIAQARKLIKEDILSTEDNEIAREIEKIFKEINISSKDVLVNIPSPFAMVKAVRLPSINDKEISDMARIESIKQASYTDEDIISGHRAIEKFKNGYSNVLIAIVHAAVVKRILNIFESAGLNVQQIALSSEALLAWFLSVRKDFEAGTWANAVLINMDFGYADIDIIERENLVGTRGILYGSYGFDGINRVADEVRETVLTYQKKRNINMDKIFLCGAQERIERLAAALKDSLNIPLQKMPQMKSGEHDKDTAVDLGEFSFLALKGLLAGQKDIRVNMMPRAVLEHNRKQSIKKNTVKLLIFCFCIWMAVLSIAVKKISDKSMYLSSLDKQLKIIEQDVFEGKKIKRSMDIIKNNGRGTFHAIDALAEFYYLAPKDVAIDLLDYDKGRSLVLRGTAPALNTVIEFVTAMEGSLYFEDVKVRYAAEKKGIEKTTDFEIVSAVSDVEK